MSPDPRLSELIDKLIEKWRVEAATSEADATSVRFDDWRDKLTMSARAAFYRAGADELAAVLLGGTPQPQEPSTANAVMDGGCVVLTGEARAWQSIFDNAWQTIARQGKEIAGLQKQLAKERRAASGGIAQQTKETEEEAARVAPSVPRDEPAGSTADKCTGAVTAAERTDEHGRRYLELPAGVGRYETKPERIYFHESRSPDGDGQQESSLVAGGSRKPFADDNPLDRRTPAGSEPADSLTPLDVDIADVVACFTKWNRTAAVALDNATLDALHELVAEWKRHRKQLSAAASGGIASSPRPETDET